MNLYEIQTKRIRYNTETRERHGSRAQHRIHRDPEEVSVRTCRYRNQKRIVNKCPEQILQYITVSFARESDSCCHIQNTALHEHNIRGIDCNIRSGSDRNADISSGQSRRVVYTVADHSYFSLLLKSPNHCLLAVRQYAGDDFVDACRPPYCLRSLPIVAGQHNNMNAHISQLADGLRTVFLHRISDGNNSEELIPGCEEKRRLSVGCQFFGFSFYLCVNLYHGRDKTIITAVQCLALKLCGKTVSGEGSEVGDSF